jgi:lysophospholipase L1-like esterase
LTVSNTVPVTVGDAVNVTINSDSFAMFFRLCLNTNVPVSTVSYTNAIAYFYGDSVTEGYNPNPPYTNLASRFPALLCTNFAMIESNNGVGGSQIADPGEADMIEANNAIYGTNVSVWLAGYNDVFYYGTNAAALDDNEAAMESLAAWLAIPTSVRVPCNNTNNDIWNTWHTPGLIYYSAGWVFFPTLGGSTASTAVGNYAQFYFTGNTLLIGTARVASGGGVETVVVGDIVDAYGTFIPTATNTYSCVRTSADTHTARSYSPGLIMFTNLSNAAIHGAILTAQSAANCWLCWYAAYSTNQLPKVVLAGTLKPAGSNYMNPNLPSGFYNGSDLAANQYSGMISNVAATLSAAKLNVSYVPVPVLDSNTDWEFDGIHPNESGHLKLKNAIQAAF